MPAPEALYAAKRQFGHADSLKEQCRDQRGWTWLEQLMQDFRHAARTLTKSRAQTAAAVFTLALGIGLVTIQFSVVNGILLKGLPFENPDRIVTVTPLDPNGRRHGTPVPEFVAWREHQKSFTTLAALSGEALEIGGENLAAHTYRGAAFSASLLEMLGVRPSLGRSFTPEDEHTDAPSVVLLSHRAWRNDFAADPAIVGRAVRLRGEAATVIGVMPEGFGFPESEQAWVNLRAGTATAGRRAGVVPTAQVLGRLRDDVTMESARAEFDVLVRQTGSNPALSSGGQPRALIRLFLDQGRGKAGTVILSLLGIVGGVLALAALNVANLLSARALQRAPELAVRSALGASRSRLIRQLVTESVLLALLGAASGLVLASWGVPLINRQLDGMPDKPFWITVALDFRVFLFAITTATLIGILAGLFPAWRATRRGAGEMLKDASGRGGSGGRLGRINRGLVIAQLTLSSALLIVTAVLVNTVWSATRIGFPFDPETVLTGQLRLTTSNFTQPDARTRFYDALLERMRATPGVMAATLSERYPVERGNYTYMIETDGPSRTEVGGVISGAVAAGFFRDLQLPLREGREFGEHDTAGSERVAVVNESLARSAWPGESAIGKQFRTGGASEQGPWITVIGVVSDLASDHSRKGNAYYHIPLAQAPSSEAFIFLRTAGQPLSLERAARDAVRSLSLDVPLDGVMPLSARIRQQLGPMPIFGAMGLAFGASGLFLAAFGVYAVAAFTVQRRTREFGVRIALGARPQDLFSFVFRQGLRQLAIGLACGIILGSVASLPMLKKVADPISALAYLLILAIIALAVTLALWFPARRAARVDPIVALHAE